MNKLTRIIGTVVAGALIVGGTLVYIGHENSTTKIEKNANKNSKSYSSSSSENESSLTESIASSATSSSESTELIASGTDYNIKKAGGVGGVFAKPTPITKIFDEKTVLDVVASTPNLDHSKLVSVNPDSDSWQVTVTKNGMTYIVTVDHYQGKIGIIQVHSGNSSDYTQYGLTIPENFYAPYRQAEADANQAFSSSIKNQENVTLEEGLNLIQEAGGEVPSSDAKIISSTDNSITIGGGVGAKGYDKITLTPDTDGNVKIHEEFGTLDGGSYSVLDYMPAKDFTVSR